MTTVSINVLTPLAAITATVRLHTHSIWMGAHVVVGLDTFLVKMLTYTCRGFQGVGLSSHLLGFFLQIPQVWTYTLVCTKLFDALKNFTALKFVNHRGRPLQLLELSCLQLWNVCQSV